MHWMLRPLSHKQTNKPLQLQGSDAWLHNNGQQVSSRDQTSPLSVSYIQLGLGLVYCIIM